MAENTPYQRLFRRFLRDHGLPVTQQREAIARVVFESLEHLSVEEIEGRLRAGGNRCYLVKEIPGLNHLFQSARTGSPNEYAGIDETMSPIAMETVADWILHVSAR